MMKVEFEARAGKTVSVEDYQIIETVYLYYPANLTKDETAELYKRFGLRIFVDMLPRAKKVLQLETQMAELTKQLEELRRQKESL